MNRLLLNKLQKTFKKNKIILPPLVNTESSINIKNLNIDDMYSIFTIIFDNIFGAKYIDMVDNFLKDIHLSDTESMKKLFSTVNWCSRFETFVNNNKDMNQSDIIYYLKIYLLFDSIEYQSILDCVNYARYDKKKSEALWKQLCDKFLLTKID